MPGGSWMPELETRWPCPVCLGVKLEKVTVGGADDPVRLDHCLRCGGVWFEHGEIPALRARRPEQLWAVVAPRGEVTVAWCHACRAPMARDAERCAACGGRARLDCPSCQQPMEPVRHGGATLDVCRRCKGVWFDHHELELLWKAASEKALARARERGLSGPADAGAAVLLDAMVFAPDLAFLGAHAAVQAAAASGHLLTGAPGAVGAAAETAAEAASSVFEVLVEIVAGLF